MDASDKCHIQTRCSTVRPAPTRMTKISRDARSASAASLLLACYSTQRWPCCPPPPPPTSGPPVCQPPRVVAVGFPAEWTACCRSFASASWPAAATSRRSGRPQRAARSRLPHGRCRRPSSAGRRRYPSSDARRTIASSTRRHARPLRSLSAQTDSALRPPSAPSLSPTPAISLQSCCTSIKPVHTPTRKPRMSVELDSCGRHCLQHGPCQA